MSPFGTFFTGLLLLALFAWYFFTDSDRIKRILGTTLSVLLVFLCLVSVYPAERQDPARSRSSGRHLFPRPSGR
jgi:hypothetical membrane protein